MHGVFLVYFSVFKSFCEWFLDSKQDNCSFPPRVKQCKNDKKRETEVFSLFALLMYNCPEASIQPVCRAYGVYVTNFSWTNRFGLDSRRIKSWQIRPKKKGKAIP